VRPHVERREEAGRYVAADDAFGLAVAREDAAGRHPRRDIFKDRLLRPPVEVVGISDGHRRHFFGGLGDGDQPLGMREGDRAQQHGVDD
jgi:hypothetical protein